LSSLVSDASVNMRWILEVYSKPQASFNRAIMLSSASIDTVENDTIRFDRNLM